MPSGSERAQIATGAIVGAYRVEEQLGMGGMGYVMAARHLENGRRVALKFLWPSELDADAIARMDREARALASLRSKHATRVFGFERTPDGQPYIVMELVEGRSLVAMLRDRKVLPIYEAARQAGRRPALLGGAGRRSSDERRDGDRAGRRRRRLRGLRLLRREEARRDALGVGREQRGSART